uniref:guanylate cyclase n=1 Tax=Haemonchus contortus TaxID=6289 RepID=W6NCA6_HAECO
MTGDSRLTQSNFGDYEIHFLENDAVLTKTYPAVGLTEDDKSIFPQMRKWDHDNVNRFIGLSIDGSEYIAIWRMCSRGLLWLAPEHLRSPESSVKKSKEGDIYSFAIVASEVVTRKAAWNLTERKERIDELLYMLKKGGPAPPRPDLNVDGEINVAVTMMPDSKANLMDHMFNMLEDYTTTLELDVEERTKQLQEEKKKADVLLGKMLPRQVADRLKLGQAVEPESFDSVTVFFSDVVKFTQLAAKCTPFQVVNLLNDLYNGFDSIIEDHSAYKVESIGDGYLCVSGLPVRNGSAHIKEIAELSLSFMKFVDEFRVVALPRERVQLRIGLNSGPCVAGVVGLSMPRYCLFGDTVNTASRMESNGKPGHIHMSKEAHDLLVNEYHADYETQSRGEVIIKGKGVMETFWLIGRRAASSTRLPPEERVKRKTEEHSEQLKDDTNISAELSTAEKTPPSTPDSVSSNTMYKEYLRSNTIEVS